MSIYTYLSISVSICIDTHTHMYTYIYLDLSIYIFMYPSVYFYVRLYKAFHIVSILYIYPLTVWSS